MNNMMLGLYAFMSSYICLLIVLYGYEILKVSLNDFVDAMLRTVEYDKSVGVSHG